MNGGVVMARGLLIDRNTADGDESAGASQVGDGGDLTLEKTIFITNRGDAAGGIRAQDSTSKLTATRRNVLGNHAEPSGVGGILNVSLQSTLDLVRTIAARNTPTNCNFPHPACV